MTQMPLQAWALASALGLSPLPSPGTNAIPFQGDLVMHASSSGASATMLFSVSGKEGRMDVRANLNPQAALTRFSLVARAQDSGKVWMLEESELGQTCSALPAGTGAPDPDSAAYAVKTGVDTTVQGLACKQYLLTRKGERVEALLAPELKDLESLLARFQAANPKAAGKPLGKALAGKGFPIAYRVERDGGKAVVEVVHVRRGPLADGKLSLPPGCAASR